MKNLPWCTVLTLVGMLCPVGTALFAASNAPTITSRPFGDLPDGQSTRLFTLQNADGFRVEVSNFGAIVVSIFAPDREGRFADVVLGLNNAGQYLAHTAHFGGTVGRYANRIALGKFTLDGQTYSLPINNEPNGIPCCLHGGKMTFDKKVWSARPAVVDGNPTLTLTYTSRDGEEGFPGNLTVGVTYTVTPHNELRIDYTLTTDKPTPANVTNHSYFNLRGEGSGLILDEVVAIHAQRYTPVNAGMIPTGAIEPVAGTPLDFTSPHRIGERIDSDNEQLKLGWGYDHNWVVDKPAGELGLAASAYDPASGRMIEVLTTEPGVQFYTGNHLDGTLTGKSGKPYPKRSAFCFETQRFPDSPNHPNFPTSIVRPGEIRRSTTVYRFSAK